MRTIQVFQRGGTDRLQLVELPVPEPGRGELLVRVEAIGVNFIDVYHRTGLYPRALPFSPGNEVAGVVERVGSDVTEFSPGDRVASASAGAYAEYALVPVARAVPLPDGGEAHTAAAALLQGMTAHYLAHDARRLTPGSTALVHAAAGGTGGLLVQFAKQLGARVFATASTAKLDTARELGADEVIDYTRSDFAEEVLRATDGRGVDVVYDSVGKATFEGSLRCVGLRGHLVMFGQSSGPVPPFDPLRLSRRSMYLTRPTLGHYTASRSELLGRAAELFAAVASGEVRIRIDRVLPLEEAATAHQLLEGRATAGKVLLVP